MFHKFYFFLVLRKLGSPMKTSICINKYLCYRKKNEDINNIKIVQQYYFHQNIFLRFSIRLLVTQSGSPKKTPIKFFNKILIENIRNIKKYEIHQQDFSPKSFFEIVTKIIKCIQIVNKIIYTKNVFGIITNIISKKNQYLLQYLPTLFLRFSPMSSSPKLSTRSPLINVSSFPT